MSWRTDPFLSEEQMREQALDELSRRLDESFRRDAERPQRPVLPIEPEVPFLPTSVAGRIFSTVERCLCMRGNGLIVGAPGVGKTMALAEAKRRSDDMEGPEVAIVKVEPAYGASAMVLFEELAPLLGVQPSSRGVAATVQRLKREVYFRPLVIFDEMQNLSLRVAHQLLSISEDAGIRMLFVGNPESLKLVNSNLADVRLISRRLPYRDEIKGISDADADLVSEHFGVEEMDAFRLCRRIGSVFHMDGIVQVLRDVRHRQGGAKTIRAAEIETSLQAFPHLCAGIVRADAAKPIALRQRTAGRPRLIARGS